MTTTTCSEASMRHVCPTQRQLAVKKPSAFSITLQLYPSAAFTGTRFDYRTTFPQFFPIARGKPIPIRLRQRLPTSSCIGNAPALNSNLLPCITVPAHSRYNPHDFATTTTTCRAKISAIVPADPFYGPHMASLAHSPNRELAGAVWSASRPGWSGYLGLLRSSRGNSLGFSSVRRQHHLHLFRQLGRRKRLLNKVDLRFGKPAHIVM